MGFILCIVLDNFSAGHNSVLRNIHTIHLKSNIVITWRDHGEYFYRNLSHSECVFVCV